MRLLQGGATTTLGMCNRIGVLRASRVVLGFWWDPVCRLLHLRARELLITGEYRARVLLVLLPGCIR